MTDSDKRQKREDAQRNGRSEVWLRFDLKPTVKAPEVKVYRGQAITFSSNVFSSITSDLLGPDHRFCYHCVRLVKTDRMIPNLTLKGQGQSGSYCIKLYSE